MLASLSLLFLSVVQVLGVPLSLGVPAEAEDEARLMGFRIPLGFVPWRRSNVGALRRPLVAWWTLLTPRLGPTAY